MLQVYITGTGKGLGKAIAEVLLERDDTVVFGLSRQQTIFNDRYHHHTIDLSKPHLVKDFKFEVLPKVTKVVLLNNAGQLGNVNHFGQMDPDAMIDAYNVNLLAPALLTNSFVQTFGQNAIEKVVINVTSGAAQNPYDGWATYCSSKAALDMLTRVGAQEQQIEKNPYPFTYLSVAPGVVDTHMQADVRASNPQGFSNLKRFHDLQQEGKLYSPAAVAKAYLDIIDNPSSVPSIIHRVVL